MVCQCKLPADVWMDDPTQWPPLSYPDLYHYLIKTPGVYTQEKMEITKPYMHTSTFCLGGLT